MPALIPPHNSTMREESKKDPETLRQYMLDFSSMSLGSRNVLRTSRRGSDMGGLITAVSIDRRLLEPLNLEIDPSIQAVRTNEANQIKGLNNNFVAFIDKVRLLEQQNKMLETKWRLMQDQATAHSSIEPMFHSHISNLQKQQDQLNNDTVRLDLEKEKMDHELEVYKTKHRDEIVKRVTLENEFVLQKRGTDAFLLSNLGLENRVSALVDERNFLRLLHEQDLNELQSSVKETSVVVEMDNSRGLDMKQTIADVKAQYEDVAACGQKRAESWYKTKIDSLSGKAGQTAEELSNNKAEIDEMIRHISRLQKDIVAVKGQRITLESQIAEVEARGETAVKNAKTEIKDVEAALQKAKWDMARQIRAYQDLMNIKLALEIEISTYRKLLEGEETNFGQQSITKITSIQPSYRLPEARTQPPARTSPVVIKTVVSKDSSASYQ